MLRMAKDKRITVSTSHVGKHEERRETNFDAVSFCTAFARRPTPGLAVMLHGEWGCGKTWFLKHRLMPAIRGGTAGQPCLYVTLNGLATKEEIQAKVFQAIAAESAEGKKGSHFIKEAIDKGARFIAQGAKSVDHWAMGGIKLLTTMAAESAAKVYFDEERPVIVFDDFERCPLLDAELLGLLNYYVEHLRLPVFVVCNLAEKLRRAETDKAAVSADGRFAMVLEKVVGSRLTVKPEIELFMRQQVGEVQGQPTKAFLNVMMPTLLSIADKLDRVNLRSWRLALYHFATIDAVMVEAMGIDKCQEHADGREMILRRVLAATIHSRDNGTSGQEVFELLRDRIHHRDDENKNDHVKREMAEKLSYLTDSFLNNMVTFDESPYAFIPTLVDDGVVDQVAIVRLSNLWTGYGVTETERQIRFLSADAYNRLEDQELNGLVRSTLVSIAKGGFKKPDVFRTLSRNILMLAKIGYIDIELVAVAKSIEQGVEATDFDLYAGGFELMNGRSGPAYGAEDSLVMKLMADKMRRQFAEMASATARAKVLEGPIAFFEWACDTKNPYLDRPLFSYAEVEPFWQATLALKNDVKCNLASAFSMRFAYVDRHFKIDADEIEWLKHSRDYLNKCMGAAPKGVSGHLIGDFLKTTEKYAPNVERPNTAT